MIQLNNIDKVYATNTIETTALKAINLHVEKGEFVSVMGPSGCGKSTLLNIIGLLDSATNGEVLIDGQSVQKYGDIKLAKLRNQKIGFVFQSFHLINDLSVLDNVEIPLLYRRMSGAERKRKALAALEKVGLKARTKHFPNQLSGGQRQRVAIARAIVGEPELILADEPTGNLDSVMGAEIMDILMRLNKEENTTIVMVTHDEHLAKQTQRIIRLFDGSQVG
ncbi:MAG: ABC transporter ATP-binding protein [Candidatus Cloacimonadota bacterium]|nr:MAG: ABC transporter ATP-binding protein [Candidatus Cloacimonadota bacterium]RLC54104.1 MAG: ABC transporter ATP-binding protein [Candidatus Cloacimonadota bacterium]